MSPPFLFRIDEVSENEAAPFNVDNRGHWIPSTNAHDNICPGGGASGIWWYCNGQRIQALPNVSQPPAGSQHFKTFSMFYSTGYGFWVLKGDATNPRSLAAEAWHPLRFDYEDTDVDTYVTNAGTKFCLNWTRPDQRWPRLLFPDIYHNFSMRTPNTQYGGLRGELPVFLALIAFSMAPGLLAPMLPQMFTNGSWRVHGYAPGRIDRRGVVVYVYTAPSSWAPNSTLNELLRYEHGEYNPYYN
ncbi:hypothetical protein DM02DRAFT_651753 [Periconia macrospinosa]|uniref:Uncharacterized protein n=1 Tax=Periconia macrospinosa TaxID=97972 RepID=A0A2V1E3X1_9PLEO|nr:hypothetical protein DM02DRAFT_651753 [Periconia macrospinosa]